MEIPKQIQNILEKLEKANYEAYIVGGCVRDLLMDRNPQDWDITTNAKPEEIMKVFPDSKYENEFGTVLVKSQKSKVKSQDLPIATQDLKIDKKDRNEAVAKAEELIKQIKCEAHSLQHSRNVARYTLEISQQYSEINTDILNIAALLHDIGRVNYDDHRHEAESLRIIKKEFSFLPKKILNTLLTIVDEDGASLETSIVKQADIIDGLDVQRCKLFQEINKQDNSDKHFGWLKKNFNNEKYYKKFVDTISQKLFISNIKKFNQANFDFQVPELQSEIKVAEVTTYRSEQGYSDRRHPDEVKFEEKLDKDLERRDFTINSLAMTPSPPTPLPGGEGSSPIKGYTIVDLFGGQKDIKKRVVRAVGEPMDRFKEDALRMMRAIRFSVQLNFELEPKTQRAITKMAGAIKFISKERIHDELVKILSSDKPTEGILLLHKTKLLQYIIPELENSVDVKQNKHHTYTVFKHSIESLRHTKNKEYQVRLASLLHDIGKPKTKEGKGEEATFYNHEYAGAKMTKKIMERLKFSREDINRVTNLIRNHMFYYNTDEVTAASVRRLINKVGKDNLQDLIDLRVADRLGSGTPKAMPYKLRHLQYMMEKVQNDPVSVKMLKINGDELIPLLKIKPGPKIGAILDVLLSEVIEDPKLNDKKYLEKRSKELNELDLAELRKQAKEKIEEKRDEDDQKMKSGFYVK